MNILVHIDKELEEQENEIKDALKIALKGNQLDSLICVAGGFIIGNILENLLENTKEMWRQNLWPCLISASLAASFLAEGGLLCLTGSFSLQSNEVRQQMHYLLKVRMRRWKARPE